MVNLTRLPRYSVIFFANKCQVLYKLGVCVIKDGCVGSGLYTWNVLYGLFKLIRRKMYLFNFK